MIEEYHFGSITINGKIYTEDVEVRCNGAASGIARGEPRPFGREVLEWLRKESHIIDIEAVKRAVEQNPEVIVIGTGESGIARVTEDARNFIKEKGIELIIDKTGEATKTFNVICEESLEEEGKQKKVIGLFHLTC